MAATLSGHDFVAWMIDGVRLADEVWVLVALGIDMEGRKVMLDFEEGPSENTEIVSSLLDRLKSRGLREPERDRRLLVVRDGSKAIRSAVARHWPRALQQECQIHMHRRVRQKLRCRDRADFDVLCKRLREAQGKETSGEAFDELLDFVSERNATEGVRLGKRREALLAVQQLKVEVPSTLFTTMLNTNCIENAFRNWREATDNVKRWRTKGDMVSRWTASGMLWAEAGFRRIRHHGDLPELADALREPAGRGNGREREEREAGKGESE